MSWQRYKIAKQHSFTLCSNFCGFSDSKACPECLGVSHSCLGAYVQGHQGQPDLPERMEIGSQLPHFLGCVWILAEQKKKVTVSARNILMALHF